MTLKDYTIEGDKITLTRQEIQGARDHFSKEAEKYLNTDSTCLYMYYQGKANVLTDILKMFESLEERTDQ